MEPVSSPVTADLPFVSVVVPTYNRASLVKRCVASLVAQDYPAGRYEVLVVDDGSRDETPAVMEPLAGPGPPEVRYFRESHGGASAARNAGLAQARGDPICFVDDDEEIPTGWLGSLVEGARQFPEAGCLGGPMLLRLEARPPRTCGAEPLGESELDLGGELRAVEEVWGGNMAVRRRAVEAVGPFREFRLLGGVEVEWQHRLHAAGIPVVYVPSAPLYHRRTAHELRLRWLLRRRLARGFGQARNMADAGRPYRWRSEAQGVRYWFGHWARTGCSVGLLGAAQDAGRLLAIAQLSVRRRLERQVQRNSVR